jgi:hypothetical protein
MSQDGLNLNTVRNGDTISNTSNRGGNHTSTTNSNVQFAPPTVRKTQLEAPSSSLVNNSSSISHSQHQNPSLKNGPSSSRSSHQHHKRNPSATVSEDGRRKYFPKLLQPPKQRHTGMYPSPSTSINSVVSASNNGRNQKNGHGKIVSD